MKKSRKKSGKPKATSKSNAARKAARSSRKVLPVPKGYGTVTPMLVCRNASEALAFYAKVFSAKELMRMPNPDGTVAHAEMKLGDSRIMLADEAPDRGASAPQTVGGSPVHIFLYLPKVDHWFQRAVAAGATVEMPPTDMFWGDRYCKFTDPFGHKWSMATHIEDLTPKQMAKRGEEAAKG
jgi:uncharacterized glyoxalase superfamily protein PhnB